MPRRGRSTTHFQARRQSMAGICLLVSDGERGKVYRAPGRLHGPEAMEIIYDQVNFRRRSKTPGVRSGDETPEEYEDFARTLCRVLQHACEAGVFDHL